MFYEPEYLSFISSHELWFRFLQNAEMFWDRVTH
jgi:hypothetical protein